MKTKSETVNKTVPYDQEKALRIIRNFGVKPSTASSWEKKNAIPLRYFKEVDLFQIHGVSILQKRVDSGLSQQDFIEKFNTMFDMNLSQALVSKWENGGCKPHRAYQNYLNQFYKK